MEKNGLIISGTSLIGLALTPTPDDVTVISPAIQFITGTILLFIGLIKKDKNSK